MTTHTWIKICGVTDAADAQAALDLGADAIGFVFHSASPRVCPLRRARAIIQSIRGRVVTVGVWLDEPAEAIQKSARFVGCDIIQTYQPHVAWSLHTTGMKVLPAIAPSSSAQDRDACLQICQSWSGRILVDRTRRASPESTVAQGDPGAVLSVPPERMVLAGGLTPETVRSRLLEFPAHGVDVASGVESEPGKKCRRKMADFIREVRAWDAMVVSAVSGGSSSPKR
jgi:phosphoribosylanthranilate isomerase